MYLLDLVFPWSSPPVQEENSSETLIRGCGAMIKSAKGVCDNLDHKNVGIKNGGGSILE